MRTRGHEIFLINQIGNCFFPEALTRPFLWTLCQSAVAEDSWPDYDSTRAPHPPPSASSLTLNVRSSRKLICVGVKSSRLHCGSHYISNVAGLPWAEVSRNGQQRLFKNVSRNAAQRGREIWICIFVRVQGFPCFLFVILFQNLTVCKSDFCIAVICIMLRLWTAERDAFAIYSYYFITVRLETASAIIALLHDNTDL